MQIDVKREDLADPVAWVARSLPTRPPMQVLLGIKVKVEAGTATFSAFDYEQSATTRIQVESGSQDGAVLVPGRLLSDIAKALPPDMVKFALEGNRVILTCGPARFTLPTMQVEDYPELPQPPAPLGMVNPVSFAEAVKRVAVAASTDDTLPVLTGIRAEVDPARRKITLVATDRYRLSMCEVEYAPGEDALETHLLIPGKALQEFAQSMGTDVDVVLGAEPGGGSGMFSMSNGTRTATSRLLEGDFPKYDKLLPKSFDGSAVVSTAMLTEALKRVQLVAQKNTPAKLSFSDGQVLLEAGAGDDAQAREVVEIAYEGEPIVISFNISYLLDGLKAVGAAAAKISLVSSSRPATITPSGEDDNTGMTYLIMPVRDKS